VPAARQLGQVLGVERREDRPQPLLEIAARQELAMRIRRRREAVEHADALRLQRSKELPQRCVLAADARNVSESNVGKIKDCIGGCVIVGHADCLPWSSEGNRRAPVRHRRS
jgi:hypothetical protein